MKWLCVASGILLLLAIPSWWPYGYYVLLRWVIFISSLFVAYNFYKSKLQGWVLVFAGIAFIFNPLFPIYQSKSTWIIIDFISAVIFFIALGSVKKNKI